MSTLTTCNKCGCQDIALTTAPVFPPQPACPNPEPCSEAFDSKCVYYTDDDIMCGTDIVVHQDDTVETALNDIVSYFCTPTVAYSDVLVFSPSLDSMRYYCNGVQLDVKYGTVQSNITAYVAMLNSNTNFNIYGQYTDNGDGRVKLMVPYSKAKTFCPGGVISLVAFYD